VHVVAKGQTLGRIAKRYRVSVEALREANGLRVGQHIHPGLSLVIPGKSDGTGARGPRAAKAKDPEALAEPHGPKRRGFVRMERGSEKLEVQMLTRRGRLAPTALAGVDQLLRFYPTGAKAAIDPRLVALIGRVSEHFGGRTIHVVSGFRPYTPAQYTLHSNHNVGRAMDFWMEGVPNTVLRDFCRTFRDAGVGYYPKSTFVHLDVRTGKAFWIDYARPGEPPRYDAHEATGDPEPHEGADGSQDGVDGSR
jgi:uncharacterized protein YcbK (DUF882 family)